MTEQLEYRISVYTVLFYLAVLLTAVYIPVRYLVPAAVFMLSPVLAALFSPGLLSAAAATMEFWAAISVLLIPHAFAAFVIHRDSREHVETEFWPLTAVLFGLPAVLLYGHLRMRGD